MIGGAESAPGFTPPLIPPLKGGRPVEALMMAMEMV